MIRLRRLFVLAPDCHAGPSHYGLLWRRHFVDGLSSAAEQVYLPADVDFSWARSAQSVGTVAEEMAREECGARLAEQILSIHARSRLDAVVSYCFAKDLSPTLVSQIKQAGIPWINFFCDSTHRFPEIAALARITSLNWFPESAAATDYEALRVPCVCLPYALNPRRLPDLRCTIPERSAAFVGVPSGNRITSLGWLRLMGHEVAIRGKGWVDSGASPFASLEPSRRRWLGLIRSRGLTEKVLRRCFWPMVRSQAGSELSEAEFPEYVRATRVLLGLNQGRDASGRLQSYLKFRDLEFPGYGCCYLTEWNHDLALALKVGGEVCAYRSLREASILLKELRNDPEGARELGRLGRERVMSSHTWTQRLPQLEEALNRQP